MKKPRQKKSLPVPHVPAVEAEVVETFHSRGSYILPKITAELISEIVKEMSEEEFRKEKTASKAMAGRSILQQFEACMANRTMDDMRAWFDAEAQAMALAFGFSVTKAESVLRENLGYMTGYYPDGADQLEYLHQWLDIKHPLFGTPEQMRHVTPEQAFALGQEWARNGVFPTEEKSS